MPRDTPEERERKARIRKANAAKSRAAAKKANNPDTPHYVAKKRKNPNGVKGKPRGVLNDKIVTPENTKMKGPICGAPRTGRSSAGPGICHRPAGWGTNHVGYGKCRWHGGMLPTLQKHAEKEMALDMAKNSVELLGLPVEMDPHEALLREVHRTVGVVEWLDTFIKDLDDPQKLKQITDTGIRPAVWVEMFQSERTHLARVSKMAIDAGVSERKVQLAEEQGKLIGMVFQMFLHSPQMDFTPAQMMAAPKALREAMTKVPTAFDAEQLLADDDEVVEAELVEEF